MKIGFIGLGTMGGSMAYNALDGGNEMVVHDINPARPLGTWKPARRGQTLLKG